MIFFESYTQSPPVPATWKMRFTLNYLANNSPKVPLLQMKGSDKKEGDADNKVNNTTNSLNKFTQALSNNSNKITSKLSPFINHLKVPFHKGYRYGRRNPYITTSY